MHMSLPPTTVGPAMAVRDAVPTSGHPRGTRRACRKPELGVHLETERAMVGRWSGQVAQPHRRAESIVRGQELCVVKW